MKLSQLAMVYVNALNTDTDLANWVSANLSTSNGLKIFFGYDDRDPPSVQDAPYIVVVPESKDGGPQVRELSLTINIHFVIGSNSVETSGKIVKHKQLELIEDFGEEIWKVILNADDCYPPTSRQTIYDTWSQFPICKGSMSVLTSYSNTIGGFD